MSCKGITNDHYYKGLPSFLSKLYQFLFLFDTYITFILVKGSMVILLSFFKTRFVFFVF